MLYQKQAQTVNNLYKIYNTPNHISQHHLFISGEMGVGKTYIASALINKLKAKKTLIACPKTVANKWLKVVKEFNPDKTIAIYNTKMMDLPEIVIVKQNDLFKFANHFLIASPNQANKLKQFQKEIAYGVKRDKHKLINRQSYLNDTDINNIFDFAIFDEIHLYQPTHQDFSVIALLSSMNQRMLGLTGTIFNQNVSNLVILLAYTNVNILQSIDDVNNTLDYYSSKYLSHVFMSPSKFYLNVWRYIGSQISLNDIEKKKDTTNEINQQVMPLKGLDLTDEQEAWQKLAYNQLKHLNINKNKQSKLITSYLDLPSQTQIAVTKHTNMNYNDCKIYQESKSFIGMQLTPIKLQETAKFKQLQNILKENPAKTLIFVEDTQLLNKLADQLDNTTFLPKNVKKENIAQKLNDLLIDYNNVIVTSKQVNVGIDVNNAQNVIWYQVPSNVATIIQANRRVLRLNSQTPSKVWYLYYKNTEQEKVITEVSKAAVNNAAAYNNRLNDNLARVTHILFSNL